MYINGRNVDLRETVKSKGLPWFRDNIMGTLMESVDGRDPVITCDDFSIKELREAVDTADFPILTGQLVIKKVQEAYQTVAKLGDTLTTRMPSNKLIDRVTGIKRRSNLKKIKEGMPYEQTAQLSEEYIDIAGDKWGEILDITEEMVMFDQTHEVFRRASRIGEDAALEREYEILATIQDLTGYKGWNPSGSQVDLYQTAAAAPHTYSNLITNILTDHTDINAAYLAFAAMRNENGMPIVIQPKVLLVPVALKMTSQTLMKSSVMLGTYNATPNPVQNDFKVESTAFLDMNSSVNWYLGDFKKQFVWKEVIPFQVQSRNKNTEDGWKRDIYASFKVRYYGTCAALDYLYVIKSTGAV